MPCFPYSHAFALAFPLSIMHCPISHFSFCLPLHPTVPLWLCFIIRKLLPISVTMQWTLWGQGLCLRTLGSLAHFVASSALFSSMKQTWSGWLGVNGWGGHHMIYHPNQNTLFGCEMKRYWQLSQDTRRGPEPFLVNREIVILIKWPGRWLWVSSLKIVDQYLTLHLSNFLSAYAFFPIPLPYFLSSAQQDAYKLAEPTCCTLILHFTRLFKDKSPWILRGVYSVLGLGGKCLKYSSCEVNSQDFFLSFLKS